MRLFARVAVITAALIMTAGTTTAVAETVTSAGRLSFHAEPGAWPVSDKVGGWDTVEVWEYEDIVKVDAETPGGWDYIRIELSGGTGTRLGIGTYDNARNRHAYPDGPGIQVISGSFGCGDDYAAFTIERIERSDDGTLTGFDATVEQRCGAPAGPAFRARVHYNR